MITGATAVVKSVNTKILDEYDNDDYFNIDNLEYEIEILVVPKEGENIRYTKIFRYRLICFFKKRFILLLQNNFFAFKEMLAAKYSPMRLLNTHTLVLKQRIWAF